MRPSLARLLAFVPDIDASLQSFPIFSRANWHPMVMEGRASLHRFYVFRFVPSPTIETWRRAFSSVSRLHSLAFLASWGKTQRIAVER